MARKYSLSNDMVFHDYFSRLKTIALSMFEWEGLPESCNARYLENTLFRDGAAVFVKDKNMSFLNLRVTPNDMLNVYDEHLSYTAYSTNYHEVYKHDECVYIRNNPLAKSTESTILLFAEKLADLDLAIMVNSNAQKTPLLLRCDEKTKHSLETLYKQYDGNKPAIFVSKNLIDLPFEAIKTDAPFVADRLREEKRAVWNEALEFLGLNTNPSDKKKERLVVNEVDANNEQIDIQCETMLHERMEACKKINAMFGLNVSVKKRVEKEAVERGEVHNRT